MTMSLQINSLRLQGFIDDFAAFGRTAKGGVTRLALSAEDKAARDYFVTLAQAIACTVRIDAMGNIFVRRAGTEADLPPVLVGSHGDSQPQGGRYDGIYGVLAGLEVLYTLHEKAHLTRRSIELVWWSNEEGARFAPAMIGSAVFAGASSLATAHACRDAEGITLKDALQQIAYDGADSPVNAPFAALELHIEQGPILERDNTTIGIVTGAFGQKWFDVSFAGQAGHAGTTPMDARRDALLGLAQAVQEVNRIGLNEPHARATVGWVSVEPNSRNVIPGYAQLSVEFRHVETEALNRMEAALRAAVSAIANSLGLLAEVKDVLSLAPVHFHPRCIDAVRAATEVLAYSHQDIVSGAGHDACNLNRIAPTGMIFIPCIDGLSHHEAEAITPLWRDAGATVLLHSVLKLCAL